MVSSIYTKNRFSIYTFSNFLIQNRKYGVIHEANGHSDLQSSYQRTHDWFLRILCEIRFQQKHHQSVRRSTDQAQHSWGQRKLDVKIDFEVKICGLFALLAQLFTIIRTTFHYIIETILNVNFSVDSNGWLKRKLSNGKRRTCAPRTSSCIRIMSRNWFIRRILRNSKIFATNLWIYCAKMSAHYVIEFTIFFAWINLSFYFSFDWTCDFVQVALF